MLQLLKQFGPAWLAIGGGFAALLTKQLAEPLIKWFLERLKDWFKHAGETSVAEIDDRAKLTEQLAKERAEAIARADMIEKEATRTENELRENYRLCELSLRDEQLKHLNELHALANSHGAELLKLNEVHTRETQSLEATYQEKIRRLQQSIEAKSFLNTHEYLMSLSPEVIEGFARMKREQLAQMAKKAAILAESEGDSDAQRTISEDQAAQ